MLRPITLIAVLVVSAAAASCGVAPPSPSIAAPTTAAALTPALSPSVDTGTDVAGALPGTFERVADAPVFHGSAVGRTTVVAIPDGSFLLLRPDDTPEGGPLLHSEDGRLWHEVDRSASGLRTARIEAIAANRAAVVAIGADAPRTGDETEPAMTTLWSSSDGLTWTRVPVGDAFETAGVREITGARRGFAALGDAPTSILVSGPDARQWRQAEVELPPGIRASVDHLGSEGDTFLALGTVEGQPAAWRWDGANWWALRLDVSGTVSDIASNGGRILVTGTKEIADATKQDGIRLRAVARQSTDGGISWTDIGLNPRDDVGLSVLASPFGFLAVLVPNDGRDSVAVLRSTGIQAWEPVRLEGAGGGAVLPVPTSVAVSGRRVVVAGNNVGTGGGGDRIAVWVGDATSP